MLIAVSSESDSGLDSLVSAHFARCPFFTMVEVEDGEIRSVAALPNPFFENRSPGQVPLFLERSGVDTIIAGGIGRRAVDLFSRLGIRSFAGASGPVSRVVEAYLDGSLADGPACHGEGAGGHGDRCGHDHGRSAHERT